MATKIQWTEETWNPIAGCSKVSAGCKNCYAIKDAHRLAGNPNEKIAAKYEGTTTDDGRNWTGRINFAEHALDQPLRWTRPRQIFVNSMSDLFHPAVPITVQTDIFEVMAKCPHHTFQILTKRADMLFRMKQIGVGVAYRLGKQSVSNFWPLPNVWLGVSVENQEAADERIPLLLETPAAVRWLSCEPLLGPLDLTAIPRTKAEGFMRPLDGRFNTIGWVVVGGESGNFARPMHPRWARDLRDQCAAAGVPFFFKQWGAWTQSPRDWCSHPSSDGAQGPASQLERVDIWRCNQCGALHDLDFDFVRVDKHVAGRLLDGREYNEFPQVLSCEIGEA